MTHSRTLTPPVDLPRAPRTQLDVLVPLRRPRTPRPGRSAAAAHLVSGAAMTLIAPTLQAFFTDRLTQQRQASPRTIAAYRDTLRLLLGFVHQHNGTTPSRLDWEDLDATMISAFLNYHMPEDVIARATPRRKRLLGFHNIGAYG